jgi:hypothetical protein
MTEAERGGSQWTGRVTIYQFFSTLTYPGFSICLRHALKYGGSVPWLCALFGAWIPIVAGLIYARRESTVLFALTIALTLYFSRRKVVPRALMGAAIVVALFGIPATSDYRSALAEQGATVAITKVDFIGNFTRFLSRPSILELRNAAITIEVTSRTRNYGLGAGYWDQLVFRFIPAQLVGRDLKRSLMFQPDVQEREQLELAKLRYKVSAGTTQTGLGDSFREFGYFGALFFAGMAVIFKSLWQSSMEKQSVFAQLLYIQTSTAGMLAITHQTSAYPPALIYNLIFVGMAVLYARTHRSAARLVGPAVMTR